MARRVTETLAGRPTAADLIALYRDFQDGTVDAIYAPDQGISVGRLLATGADREEPRDATALIDERVVLPAFRTKATIVGRVLGRDPDDEATRLHTVAVDGMAMVFHFARKDVARRSAGPSRRRTRSPS